MKLWYDEKPIYIAVSEWGFAVHQVPAMAIRLAQAHVKASAKESQLLIYETFESGLEPVGWSDGPIWPDGSKSKKRARAKSELLAAPKPPRLVGLTTTHRIFAQSLR